MTAQRKSSNTVVNVATVAADLHRVMHIAWSVSIAAKNAMIISAQAGEHARGFQPITRFIDEIAETTIAATQLVEQESIKVSRMCANYMRAGDAHRRFLQVERIGADAIHRESFRMVIERCSAKLEQQTALLRTQLHRLAVLMGDLNNEMRAALAVASVCRIEASRAGEYRGSLGVVADDLERAALEIKELVTEGADRIYAIAI